MLKIRMKRVGRKGHPFYRIVIMENLSKRDGEAIIEIGFYDPLTKVVQFNQEALHKYINCGAYPTDTVRHLISKSLNQVLLKK